MKLLIPLIIFTASITSSNAFAMHAYRYESCKSAKYDLDYTGDHIIGGVYLFSLKDQHQDIRSYPLNEMGDENKTLEDADAIFDYVSSVEFDRQETTNDGWFDIEAWKTETTIEISLIAPEASQKLDLKQGDKITFVCDESIEYPNRTETDEK